MQNAEAHVGSWVKGRGSGEGCPPQAPPAPPKPTVSPFNQHEPLHSGEIQMATTISDVQAPVTIEPIADGAMLPPLETSGASVALWEVARIAFDSLFANKVRSLLTMLGVIIGVASVVALL